MSIHLTAKEFTRMMLSVMAVTFILFAGVAGFVGGTMAQSIDSGFLGAGLAVCVVTAITVFAKRQ